MHRTATARLAALSGVAAATLAVGGCALLPSSEREMTAKQERALGDVVAGAQEAVWDARGTVKRDLHEALVTKLPGLIDARGTTGPIDATNGSWWLHDVDRTSDETVLTIATIASGYIGRGAFSSEWTQYATTCFELRVPADLMAIHTTPGDCGDLPGRLTTDRTDIVTVTIPLRDLDVADTVTAATYPPPVCQCVSGEVCDCPGG